MKHLPDREQISRIHQRIDSLAEVTSKMAGSLESTSQSLLLVNEYLLSKGNKE